MLVAGACAGGNGTTLSARTAIPDINTYPPLANGAPPGASASAVATGTAIGRGVNFGNMLEAPTEGAWGLAVTDDFIDKASAAGFASVRLPVRWSNHASADAPYTIDPVFLARVESVTDKLLAKGFVVVLNMHHYRQLDGDRLDPGELAVAAAAVDVRFVMLWEQLATRFKGRSARLVFELYNEPHGRINGEAWNLLAARALGVVRKTNRDRVVVIGPTSGTPRATCICSSCPTTRTLSRPSTTTPLSASRTRARNGSVLYSPLASRVAPRRSTQR